MSPSTPRNRKERRAAEKEQKAAESIPMSQPDRTKPKGKTLYELAAEREAALTGRRRAARPSNATEADEEPSVVTINPDGTLAGPDGEPLPDSMSAQIKAQMQGAQSIAAEPTEPDESPLADAILYTITLSMLYFTMTVLVTHQYGMSKELPWGGMAWQTVSNAPFLFFAINLLHPRASSWWAQALFLGINVGAGCWVVMASNEYGYMAVMKRAPGAATLWVWAVIESRVEFAVTGLLAVAGYMWYENYSVF